jgi:hypothetical protein
MIKFLQLQAVVRVKMQIFTIFWRNYFKNHNIGPWKCDLTWYQSGLGRTNTIAMIPEEKDAK